MFYRIESYAYSPEGLEQLRKSGVLDVEPDGYTELSIREYFAMQKSLRVAREYIRLQKAESIGAGMGGERQAAAPKAKAALPRGARWITVHPNGAEDGTPVLIQDTGSGTAHIIAGAGGKLNGLKLNKIKSKDEYAQAMEQRKEDKKRKQLEEKLREQEDVSRMGADERKEYKSQKKAAKDLQRQAEAEEKKARAEAEEGFTSYMADLMGWDPSPIEEDFAQSRKALLEEMTQAEEDGDKAAVKRLEKELEVNKKAEERAIKSQRANFMSSAKDAVRQIQRELIGDADLRAQVEAGLGGDTGAAEVLRKENSGHGKGFVAGYRESAEKKGGLDEEALKQEKDEMFSERMAEIAKENPSLAFMITRGIETNRRINGVKNDMYEREDTPRAPIAEVDKKTEVLKHYLEMKKKLSDLDKKKDGGTQIKLDGTPDEASDSVEDLTYGKGVSLDFHELLDAELEGEAERIKTERQAAVHSSLLDAIAKNPGGAEKWIANGNYSGFNSIALAAMKTEGLDRDTVDLLGVGASSRLLAMMARRSMSPEDYRTFAEGMERYHEAVNETIASEAIEKGKDLLARAESIKEEIAANPADLAAAAELNESRLSYLDEANRVIGQALGSLEASAAMVVELKGSKDPESLEVNLGDISNEDAIVRMHALGLSKDDYAIDSVGGSKVVTINAPDKLIHPVDAEELRIEEEVESIKAGEHDEENWLPAGLVRRDAESFVDPGPDAEAPAGDVDNQSLGDDAEAIHKTEEAVHRTLGEMPEGAFAFKLLEDLTPQDQTDLRRYWERNIYKGSMAEATSGQDLATGKAASRQGAWAKFLKGENGGSEEAAFAAIRQDLIANHSTEDMFGEKDVPPLARVVPGNWETYRANVDGARELFDAIDDLRDPSMVTDAAAAEREVKKLEGELPGKLAELYQSQMKEHYLKWMSGHTEEEFNAGESRQEKSPWGEYVRMHGDADRAQAAIIDRIRGDFTERFVKNYGRVTGKKLATKVEKIRNAQDHVLGMLHKDVRDSYTDRFKREMGEAGGELANRANGRFASGSWKDKLGEYIEEKKRAEAAQGDMFGGEDLKQNDRTEILSIGKRAETQLASMIPDLSRNQLRGQRYAVSTMQAKGERQRAIKMFEATKRMNLTFGTGKGKTIISIGAFTELKSKGKAKRAIFAVPSVVLSQFGNEVNVFCEPGKYRVKSDPSLSRDDRIQAMKDGKLDMVVFTHQSLRDDMVHLMAKHNGMDPEAMKASFNAQPPEERRRLLGEALKKEGIAFDMLTVDEAHYTTNRKGKEDTTLSNVIDALNQNVTYFMNQTATPVKNDISEAFDMLHKVAPDRFTDRNEFIKRYGVDSDFARRSLQRLISRYNYASPTVTGVKKVSRKELVPLAGEQAAEYAKVEEMFQRASKAQRSGTVDVEAMKALSPSSFKNQPEAKHEEIARRLQESSGTIKEEALNRVVNQFDWKKNAKIGRAVDIIEKKVYEEGNPKTASQAGDRKPGVIFAHNIQTVENLRAALEAKGCRVGIIQGSMNGAEKEKVKVGFNPPNPKDRIYDIILCSDAGATGLNLQNAAYLMNFDLPQTSWVKQQREGRIDRMGQAHKEIEYHDIVSDTEHEKKKWERIQRKKALGSIFEEDPGVLDDTGLAATIAAVRQDRYNQGIDKEKAA